MSILDVGSDCVCRGDVNLDINPNLPIDIVHDLNKLPLPFKTNQFRKVLCYHVLEHLEHPERVLDELARIGRVVEIRVPECRGSMAMRDKSHKHTFNQEWFRAYARQRGFKCGSRVVFDYSRFRFTVLLPLEVRAWLWKMKKVERTKQE